MFPTVDCDCIAVCDVVAFYWNDVALVDTSILQRAIAKLEGWWEHLVVDSTLQGVMEVQGVGVSLGILCNYHIIFRPILRQKVSLGDSVLTGQCNGV